MAGTEHETVIVDRGSSSTGILIAVIVALGLIIGGYMIFVNNNGGGGDAVHLDVPGLSVDVVPGK